MIRPTLGGDGRAESPAAAPGQPRRILARWAQARWPLCTAGRRHSTLLERSQRRQEERRVAFQLAGPSSGVLFLPASCCFRHPFPSGILLLPTSFSRPTAALVVPRQIVSSTTGGCRVGCTAVHRASRLFTGQCPRQVALMSSRPGTDRATKRQPGINVVLDGPLTPCGTGGPPSRPHLYACARW